MSLAIIVLLPFLAAALPLFARQRSRLTSTTIAGAVTAISLVLLLSLAPQTFSGDTPRFYAEWLPTLGLSFSLRLDGLTLLFAGLILGIGLLIVIYAHYYLSSKDDSSRFYARLLLFMGSMLGIVSSDNLILLWLFWELTSISS